MLVQPGSFGGIDQTLARLGHERDIRLVAAHFKVALALLAETDLVLTVPEDLAPEVAALGLVKRAVPFALEPFRHQVATSRRASEDPGLAWLVERIAGVPGNRDMSAR